MSEYTEKEPAFNGALMLAGWNSSSRSGTKVTFYLEDDTELEFFKGLEGKRFKAVLFEVDNNEQPILKETKRDRLGALCEWAVMRCKEPKFWEFLNEDFENIGLIDSEESAKKAILNLCKVTSRKEIDQRDTSLYFKDVIMSPYRYWLQREEVLV